MLNNLSIIENYDLNNLLSMRSGGVARYYYEYDSNYNELLELRDYIINNNLKYSFIAGGTNSIFVSDFDGVLIKNINKDIIINNETDYNIEIAVGGGVNWDYFVGYCVKNKYYGLENLSHIPGDVSGAPIQNIGGYGVEVGQFIKSVTVFDFNIGEIIVLNSQDCDFFYRDSIFKSKRNYFVLAVNFLLNKDWVPVLDYKDLQNVDFYSADDLRDYIIQIRDKKIPLPSVIPNCGSFFKNIIVSQEVLNNILLRFPDIIYFEYITNNDKKYKLSVGYIIDKILNMKGVRINNVGTNSANALQIVNYNTDKDQNNAKEILDFAKTIINKIKDKLGEDIDIEIEVNVM